ncbi:hypothetical protein EON83_04025 [bacterium]|nr:MAG: hypothetical protein EON83_04025 [bacterium]
MKCVTCAHENLAEAKNCSACGSPLDVSASNVYTHTLPVKTRLHNGNFSVGKVLGQGGFGITYKGGDATLRRVVAIKEFFPLGVIRHNTEIRFDRTLSVADYNAIKSKFIDEAHRLAQFAHPGIVRVFSVFEENNTAYIVMEFLEGQSLERHIRDSKRLGEIEVVDLAVKIGAALSVIHGAGLIHRDIKPDNIMLTNDGRVVLIDFGTARAFASDKTIKQTAMLTPGYAPLEQYGQQARFGAYTDVYALGATLYHALMGETPPPATDIACGIELKVPHTVNPAISRNVSQALMWAMKTKADERPQSIAAFLEALKQSGTSIPVPALVTPHVVMPSVPAAPVKGEVRVSLSGRGHYTSLSAAVRAVPAGTRIVVEEGVYQEPEGVVLDKQLEIVGPGIRSRTARIVSNQAHCLDVQTEYAVVSGLSLHCAGRPQEAKYGAVSIARGQIVLEGCDLKSDSASCVYIRNNAAPILRGCRIHDSKDDGVFIYENGRGTIENCDIFGNMFSGVEITTGAEPTLRDCRIHDGKSSGIFVHENGRGTVESCNIFANALSGIIIKTGGSVTMRDCHIHDCVQSGVYIHENGRGTLKNCDVFGNGHEGIEVKGGANLTIRDCRIYDGKSDGVFFHENGGGIVENCDIFGNAYTNIGIKSGGNPTVRNCRIHDGRQSGVYVYENGGGTIENCEIYGNALSGVIIKTGGNPTVRDCRIHDGKQNGLYTYENGRGLIENCDIFGNAMEGIEIKDGANLTVRECLIHYGKNDGVFVHENGSGTIENCDIFGNAYSGVAIRTGGNPTVRACRIHNGEQGGVHVYENGSGTIEGCDIFANALSGFSIKTGGNPIVRGCHIHDGKQSGVFVAENGYGLIENCDIFDNAYCGVGIDVGGNPMVRGSRITRNAQQGVWVCVGGFGTIEGCDLRGNAQGATKVDSGARPTLRQNKTHIFSL